MGERTASPFLGNGNGTFQPGKDSGADANPNFGVAHDFDGDRLADKCRQLTAQSTDLSILFQARAAQLHYPHPPYRTKNGPFAVAVIRLSADNAEEPGLADGGQRGGSVSCFSSWADAACRLRNRR